MAPAVGSGVGRWRTEPAASSSSSAIPRVWRVRWSRALRPGRSGRPRTGTCPPRRAGPSPWSPVPGTPGEGARPSASGERLPEGVGGSAHPGVPTRDRPRVMVEERHGGAGGRRPGPARSVAGATIRRCRRSGRPRGARRRRSGGADPWATPRGCRPTGLRRGVRKMPSRTFGDRAPRRSARGRPLSQEQGRLADPQVQEGSRAAGPNSCGRGARRHVVRRCQRPVRAAAPACASCSQGGSRDVHLGFQGWRVMYTRAPMTRAT